MIKSNTAKLFSKLCKAWQPLSKLKYSEWAEKNFILSTEDSSEPGKFNIDRAPYQIEMMDALSDPETHTVVFMTSAQIGKTTVEKIIIGYHIDQDPGPMMLILPNKDPLAKDWSRDRLAPMIRDISVLAAKVGDPKLRDGDNSTYHKKFPGGLIVITGANSPADLRSRPMRILVFDEVDAFKDTAEGDPIALASKRQMTFRNWKTIMVSTPTLEGASSIATEYLKGTQEKWNLACPHCGEHAFLNFYGIKFEHRWITDKVAEVWDAKFKCPSCLHSFDEQTWKRQPGKWIADNPQIVGTRSFHINAFYSPWYSWAAIIKEWLEAKKDPQKLQVVINTLFGLPWKEKLDVDDEDKLLSRREKYDADLHEGVLLLTCGVDTQDDRLEYEIVGWGKEKETWGIEYGMVIGDPDDPATWDMLDERLNRIFRFADGKGLKIACTCVDSGGHHTTAVYKYCKKNQHRRIFAVKGQGGPGIPLIHKLSRKNKENCLLIILGVDEGKTNIISALKEKTVGPRFMHFPEEDIDTETGEVLTSRGYDRDYFRGLLSEHQVLQKRNGVLRYVWQKTSEHIRNEAFDTRNYAQAAMEILKPNFDVLEKRLNAASSGSPGNGSNTQNRPKKRKGCVKKTDDY